MKKGRRRLPVLLLLVLLLLIVLVSTTTCVCMRRADNTLESFEPAKILGQNGEDVVCIGSHRGVCNQKLVDLDNNFSAKADAIVGMIESQRTQLAGDSEQNTTLGSSQTAIAGEGQAINCKVGSPLGAGAIYRYTNDELRWYPNPVVASAWDRGWTQFKSTDCTGTPYGGPLRMPVAVEGQAVKCAGGPNPRGAGAIYRFTAGRLRWYPNPSIAARWDGAWASPKASDCTDAPFGPDMT
jgi:hypothetical protein